TRGHYSAARFRAIGPHGLEIAASLRSSQYPMRWDLALADESVRDIAFHLSSRGPPRCARGRLHAAVAISPDEIAAVASRLRQGFGAASRSLAMTEFRNGSGGALPYFLNNESSKAMLSCSADLG